MQTTDLCWGSLLAMWARMPVRVPSSGLAGRAEGGAPTAAGPAAVDGWPLAAAPVATAAVNGIVGAAAGAAAAEGSVRLRTGIAGVSPTSCDV